MKRILLVGLKIVLALALVVTAQLCIREENKAVQQELDIQEKEADVPLEEFTLKVMDTCKAQLSEVKQKILAGQIARVGLEKFTDRRHQEAFVLLVCIESKFQANAKSKVGAVGLTQIMPQYAQEFAEKCGLGKLDKEDLIDSEVNLRIGACNLRSLIARFDGNVSLAFAGYNSGASSPTTKKMASLAEANIETANYVAKYSILKETMRNEK
jgi:hypothetical protein